MAEYGVVLAVITLVIVATLLLLSGAIYRTEQGHHSTEVSTIRSRANRAKRKVVTMMRIRSHSETESGQTMAEYALVLGVITFVIVTTFALLSGQIVAGYTRTFTS